MGTIIKNVTVSVHLAGGSTKTIQFGCHQTNISVDSKFDVPMSERANLHAAAQAGQAQFDSAMATLTGTWYNQWDAAWRNDLRIAMIKFKA